GSSRSDAQRVNGAIAQRVCEGLVHEPVMLEKRAPDEARARDDDLEVVAAAGAVVDRELRRLREGGVEERLQRCSRHADHGREMWRLYRGCARYSSRSERVSTPIGLPRCATTIAFVRPVSIAKTSSKVVPASIVASGGCIASTTSSCSASGLRKTSSSRSRSWSEPITSASEATSPSRTTGSCEIE